MTRAPTSRSRRWNSGESMMIRPAAARRRSTASSGSTNDGQHERSRLCVEIGQFLLVPQFGKGHVDGIDLGIRNAQRCGHQGILVGGHCRRLADQTQGIPARRHVSQQFDRFIGVAVDRYSGRLEQDAHGAGRAFGFVPVGGRRRQRVHDEDDDPADAIKRRWRSRLMQRLRDLERVEDRAHADVVRDTAVDEMQVGPMDAIAEGLQVAQRADRPRRRSRRVGGVGEHFYPGRQACLTAAAVVVDRHRREDHRYGRRRCGRPRQRDGVEVRADDIKGVLLEDETGAGRNVGR
ncbi:MAG: hypothetical protein AW12_01554 [Candidatus Accumulibacter sp. BA-94]|nr:MAG: hypothetical protein AW12_01554 [Candidatus Accumulibacter sp. BA-94]